MRNSKLLGIGEMQGKLYILKVVPVEHMNIAKENTFGGRRLPEIFNRLTQAVRRIVARKGFNSMVVYLDDFLVIGETKEAC